MNEALKRSQPKLYTRTIAGVNVDGSRDSVLSKSLRVSIPVPLLVYVFKIVMEIQGREMWRFVTHNEEGFKAESARILHPHRSLRKNQRALRLGTLKVVVDLYPCVNFG